MKFKKEFAKLLAKQSKLSEKEILQAIEVPPNPKLGDYAFPCFILSKKLKKSPQEISKSITEKLKSKLFSNFQSVGPYINAYVNKELFAKEILERIKKEKTKYGHKKTNKKTIVIDYSAPNIAKPFSVGHLRSTVIGDAIYKIYKSQGYKVVGVNHLGDWGTQFGKLIVAYKKWGNEKDLKKEPIKHLLKLYVKFHKQENEQLLEQGREEFKNLELGKKQTVSLWKKFTKLSLEEFERIYKILDVKFDSYNGEAFYNNKMKQAVKDLQKKVKLEKSEGALIVDLEKYNMPPVLVEKSNGTSTYHTRDIATAFFRLKKYKPEKVLYVVGMEQKLHFNQLFKVLELAGIKKEFTHVDFGHFRFPEGRMSTRKGNVIFLEDVLLKAINLAEKTIKNKNPKLKNKDKIAKAVGVGAIKFSDLSTDRVKDINFDWNKMLSFEGETGPYLQYTHARANSIIKKAKQSKTKVNYKILQESQELNVITLLSKFPDKIEEAAKHYKPHILCRYLLDLAQAFNEFYHACPVISNNKEQMQTRLLIVQSTKQVLNNGLNLLGIKAPEEM